jgi:hypothetical protein
MITYLAASFTEYAYPFLLSIGLSVVTYVTTAVLERFVSRVRHA